MAALIHGQCRVSLCFPSYSPFTTAPHPPKKVGLIEEKTSYSIYIVDCLHCLENKNWRTRVLDRNGRPWHKLLCALHATQHMVPRFALVPLSSEELEAQGGWGLCPRSRRGPVLCEASREPHFPPGPIASCTFEPRGFVVFGQQGSCVPVTVQAL